MALQRERSIRKPRRSTCPRGTILVASLVNPDDHRNIPILRFSGKPIKWVFIKYAQNVIRKEASAASIVANESELREYLSC